jgi:Anthrax toxin lethal factor, N- and C-terminal domain
MALAQQFVPDLLVVSTVSKAGIPVNADRIKGGRSAAFPLIALFFGTIANAPCDTKSSAIQLIYPPQQGFYAKSLDYKGIPIKAPSEVTNEALYAASARLAMLLSNQPVVLANLAAAGAELHIIGREQVTSDLPEHRHLKGKKLEEYHGLTVDERTRGLGGLLTSCGEENLLKLEKDRYKGRDICVHEFAHNIRKHGIPRDIRRRFDEQYTRSLEKGFWQKSYAGSNPDEFFAELTMWYFGTHGDLHMTGPKPENGREGLKKYDPEAFELLDEFYSGRMQIPKMEPMRSKLKIEN